MPASDWRDDAKFQQDLRELVEAFHASPFPSYKVTSYFPAYAELFGPLRGANCVFIETGVLNGGSLFMWRQWLGPQARIIGVDLNPEIDKWRAHDFETYVGDQGDPAFWRQVFEDIGDFDALLDDGGHQSFQQIVTLTEAVRAVRRRSLVVIEDTCTSFMNEFSIHRNHSFLDYAKASTDALTARMSHFFPGQFPGNLNRPVMEAFKTVANIQFFPGMVAYRVDASRSPQPELIWNREPTEPAADYRYKGARSSAEIDWPDPYSLTRVNVEGKSD